MVSVGEEVQRVLPLRESRVERDLQPKSDAGELEVDPHRAVALFTPGPNALLIETLYIFCRLH